MKKIVFLFLLTAIGVSSLFGQAPQSQKTPDPPKTAAPATGDVKTPTDLAKAALAAHGGDKLKQIKTLVVRGTVDVTTSAFNQAIPSTFIMVIAGDRYVLQIDNPIQQLKQIYDGKQTYSTIQGFELPPLTSLGFPLLPHIGDAGYVISAPVDAKKKRAGFRITAPDGYYTDFFVDDKTGQVKEFESSYVYGDRTVTTSVAVDNCQTVEGVVVPQKYSQRFDLGSLTAYADFKAKEILVNSKVDDDVFAMPK